MRSRDLSDVESGEHGVREMDKADAEPVAARRRNALDETGSGERAELTRYGARRHARSSRDLVRPELAAFGEGVEDRDRSLGSANSAGGRLTSARHRCRFVADSGTALLKVQFTLMSFLLSCPFCGPRPVDEYAYFGEVTTRPSGSPTPA